MGLMIYSQGEILAPISKREERKKEWMQCLKERGNGDDESDSSSHLDHRTLPESTKTNTTFLIIHIQRDRIKIVK